MKILAITAAALVAATTAAHAGGLASAPATFVEVPAQAPATIPASNWEGAYVGLSYGIAEFGFGIDEEDTTLEGNASGLFLGYNQQYGKTVLGIEMSYDEASGMELTSSNEDADDFSLIFSQTKIKGRVGYDAGRFMPYAMVGVGRFELSIDDYMSYRFRQMTYGAGLDFAVTPNFILGMEYSAFVTDDSGILNQDIHGDANTLQIRASYRF